MNFIPVKNNGNLSRSPQWMPIPTAENEKYLKIEVLYSTMNMISVDMKIDCFFFLISFCMQCVHSDKADFSAD